MKKIKKPKKEDRRIKEYLKKIEKNPSLTAEEEKELAKRIEKEDKEAKKKLIETNLRLVIPIAKKYAKKYKKYIEKYVGLSPNIILFNLIQEGNEGLYKAVKKFDWRKSYKFSTYAGWWIEQTITRYLSYLPKLIEEERRRKKALAETKIREKQQFEKLKQYLEKINKIPVLTYEEEKQLWKKIYETNTQYILEHSIL